jgi:hypothetical protein
MEHFAPVVHWQPGPHLQPAQQEQPDSFLLPTSRAAVQPTTTPASPPRMIGVHATNITSFQPKSVSVPEETERG